MSSQHYEKILLTKQDLAHVYKQFVYAAQTKIRHHLPGSDSHDPLKIEVENIVNDYLAQVFEMAKHALVVDGQDLGSSEVSIKELLSLTPTEEVVPFDAEVNQRLRSVIQAVEKETTEVTRLRRELPQQARDAYEQLVAATDQEVTAVIAELGESDALAELPTYDETVPHSAEIVDELLASVDALHRLKSLLPRQKAQLASLSQTIQFLEDSYKKQQAETRAYV